VLMDVEDDVEPRQNLDVEAFRPKDDDGRLPEVRVHLRTHGVAE
jgi:hypothetical protein